MFSTGKQRTPGGLTYQEKSWLNHWQQQEDKIQLHFLKPEGNWEANEDPLVSLNHFTFITSFSWTQWAEHFPWIKWSLIFVDLLLLHMKLLLPFLKFFMSHFTLSTILKYIHFLLHRKQICPFYGISKKLEWWPQGRGRLCVCACVHSVMSNSLWPYGP